MAGIGNVGNFGMPDYQFKSAMISTSGFAAQGTGTAKQYSSKTEEQPQLKQDGVSLSENAALSLSDEAEQLQQNQKTEQKKELEKNNQDQNKVGQELDPETQEFKSSESMEKKLQEMRLKHNAGHAAMASGAKTKESEKTEHKSSNVSFANFSKNASKSKAPATSDYGYKDIMGDLNQAAHLGILEAEARKIKSKNDEKEPLKKLELEKNAASSKLQKGQFTEEAQEAQKTDAEIKADKIRAEDIARVMNRTPEEILADVPAHFKATAEIMVTGQLNEVGEPKEALTELKTEPRTEASMMELMPAERLGDIELAETFEAMPLEFEQEIPV